MPLLTVVVPAYRVQAYLAECLDSLLAGAPTADVEVVAVDDGSPDHGGEILDDYAHRDARVRVRHLPVNVGLGAARNAGLAAATGDYVWFLDGDDRAAPGALEAIGRRLVELDPDVLIVDFARFGDGHDTRPDPGGRILADAPAGTFTAADHPAIFGLFPAIWTKVIRRRLLDEHALTFPDGFYEDLPVTFPVLAAAGAIGTLPRVCVHYRRRPGSILASTGRRHLALPDAYRLAFQRLDALGPSARSLRPAVFDHLARHLAVLLGGGSRLGAHRREYFHRASALCRQLRPPEWQPPPGADGVRYRLLERGSWPAFRLLRGGYALAREVTRGTRRATGAAAGTVPAARRRVLRSVLYRYYRLQRLLPIDPDLAAYCANWGRGYLCNPAAIYEKARELTPRVRGVWVVTADARNRLPADVDHVVEGSRRYYRLLARAHYVVNNNNFGNFYAKRPDCVFLQTHHGTPMKTMGVDQQRFPLSVGPRHDFAALLRRCDNWDYELSANPYSTDRWALAYPVERQTLEYGYPRNDLLADPPAGRAAAVRAAYGIADDATVLLYAPTFRRYLAAGTPLLDPVEVLAAAGPGSRVLLRRHYFEADEPGTAVADERVMDVSAHPRVEELYLATDVLITDYSSAMFDFALLDRPIVIYAPDWEAYRYARGSYLDLPTEAPGLFVTGPAELLRALATGGYDTPDTRARRAAFRRRYCCFDDGHAAERVVRHLFGGQRTVPPADGGTVADPAARR